MKNRENPAPSYVRDLRKPDWFVTLRDEGDAMQSMVPERSSSEIFIAALGIVIQRRRQELNLSQDEVANRSGLHRTYISEIERHSRNFSVRSFLKIVEALEWTPSELMRAAEAIVATTRD